MATPSGHHEYRVCWIGVRESHNTNELYCKGSSVSLQN